MSWAERSAANLLPLSVEQYRFPIALREWVYAGDMYDMETPNETPRTSHTFFNGRPPVAMVSAQSKFFARPYSMASRRISTSIVFLPSSRCSSRICFMASDRFDAGTTCSSALTADRLPS